MIRFIQILGALLLFVGAAGMDGDVTTAATIALFGMAMLVIGVRADKGTIK